MVLLAVLAIASGIPKLMLMSPDVEFFGRVGMSETLLVIFGIIQIASGIALSVGKTRQLGLVVMILTFVISTVVVFMNNNVVFGFVSLIPVVMAVYVIRDITKDSI